MKTIVLSLLAGVIGTSIFFLNQSKQIVYVASKPIEVIKEVYIEKPVEIEKIIYKQRSCPKVNKEKVCLEYMSSLITKNESSSEEKSEAKEGQLVKPSMLEEASKNRVNLMVGYGKSGYKVNYDGARLNIDPNREVNFGLQYERKLDKKLNGNLLLQTNQNISVGIGYDF